MDLTEFYPEPRELIKSEVAVLGFLQDCNYIVARQSQFADVARQSYKRYRNDRTGFDFSAVLNIRHAEMFGQKAERRAPRNAAPNLHLVIAARIELAGAKVYRNISYCLAVCRIRAAHPSILRKFHFDATAPSEHESARRQPHPATHLQYCGKMLPCMSQLGCRSEQLEHMHVKLSEPRIFFWPMSLALLIDMALREFPDQESTKFRADSYWRGLVRGQEALILRPFHQKCLDVIRDTSGDGQTLAEAFYVD